MVTRQMEMRVEWRCVLEEDGGQFVMTHGTIMMLKLYVGNLDLEVQVEIFNA